MKPPRNNKPGLRRRIASIVAAVSRLANQARRLSVTHPTIRIRRLPPAWDGLRIAHLSDLHAGGMVSLAFLRKVIRSSNAASPDICVLTGDFVDDPSLIGPELTGTLRGLHAREGLFAVLGNHDYDIDAAAVRSALLAAGIRILTNSYQILQRQGARLCLAGVDDFWHDPASAESILRGVDSAVPRILLCHNPDYAQTIRPRRVDLMLCGHTHGGQIKLPLLPPPIARIRYRKYVAGLRRSPACPVYTSRGVGVSGLPFRFNCPPELPIITLRRG